LFSGNIEMSEQNIRKLSIDIISNLEKVIIGKKRTIEQVVACFLSQGHLLIEDVPGTGKTMLARSLAKSIGCHFSRIQFTPDMLPSDITGVSIFNQNTKQFEFKPGPILSQIILADEINRATPKTQAALLEAMEEKQVTIDGVSHLLEKPFIVIGTQNPIEYEGTFPLPEAQLDRFLMKVSLGYPSMLEEIRILENQQFKHPIEEIKEVASKGQIINAQKQIRAITISLPVKRYIIDLVRATREHQDVYLGASPRGSLGLFRVSQAFAAIRGRDYVIPDDIKEIAESVLSHRVIIQPAAKLQGQTSGSVIQDLISTVPISSSE
jgi:MoxR-like ATPase